MTIIKPGNILTLIIFTVTTMGLFSSFKSNTNQTPVVTSINPYQDSATNLIYNLLFCDDLDLYKRTTQKPYSYPFDILYAENSSVADLQKIIDDPSADPRAKVLAYNKQVSKGHIPAVKELLAVIVEVGLEDGLDVLASFQNGTARYINHSEKILVWETADDATATNLTNVLFEKSQAIIKQIGPWNKSRRPNPTTGNLRMTFLVSDGLYFGEGPIDTLFNDPMAGPALAKATELMQYLAVKSMDN